MVNWKTTLIGLLGVIAYAAKLVFDINVTKEVQEAFVVVIVFLVALFARDANGEEGS